MTSRAAALRYARALFDVAQKDTLDLARVDRELGGVTELIESHSALERTLSNPAIPPSRKRAVVEELLKLSPVSPPLARLLTLLAERDRLTIVGDLRRAFAERVMEHQQVVRAEVTTAIPLTPERASALREGVARATGRQVHLETKVDPAIIGGAVTRIGSTVYDGSVMTQLHKLKAKLTEAEV